MRRYITVFIPAIIGLIISLLLLLSYFGWLYLPLAVFGFWDPVDILRLVGIIVSALTVFYALYFAYHTKKRADDTQAAREEPEGEVILTPIALPAEKPSSALKNDKYAVFELKVINRTEFKNLFKVFVNAFLRDESQEEQIIIADAGLRGEREYTIFGGATYTLKGHLDIKQLALLLKEHMIRNVGLYEYVPVARPGTKEEIDEVIGYYAEFKSAPNIVVQPDPIYLNIKLVIWNPSAVINTKTKELFFEFYTSIRVARVNGVLIIYIPFFREYPKGDEEPPSVGAKY